MITSYSPERILKIINGTYLLQKSDNKLILSHFSVDSRKIYNPTITCFFALSTSSRDGHQFIIDAYKKGVRCFVVKDYSLDLSALKDAWVIKVTNPLTAFQTLAAWHKNQFTLPTIAITGSNGKTIVKEWLFQLLKEKEKIVRSPKSYNSQIGVPLSLFLTSKTDTLAIFEAGISQKNEMKTLEGLIKPNLGIFTGIGPAHEENFSSWTEKAKEKLQLFKNCNQIIFCADHELIRELIYSTYPFKEKKILTWGYHSGSNLQITKISKSESKSTLETLYQNNKQTTILPFTDEPSIENCMHCWTALLALGHDHEFVSKELAKLKPVAMRLELKEGLNNCTVINDYCNSDIQSIEIALNLLEQQASHPSKIVVLSDVLESSLPPAILYAKINEMLIQKGIKFLFAVGKNISQFKDAFTVKALFFESTNELIKSTKLTPIKNSSILIKGAQQFKFDKISALIVKKAHKTVLEINLNAIQHNINAFKTLLSPTTKVMAMVKAFSYGSGSLEIARLLQFHKVDYLGVAIADEGVELRKAGISLPIMVMNPESDAYESLIEHELEPEIYSFRTLREFLTVLDATSSNYDAPFPIHIKVDTGMHRLGFMEHEVLPLLQLLNKNKSIYVASVFSHLATSDSENLKEYTLNQIDIFKNIRKQFSSSLAYAPIFHILNSSGVIAFNDAQFNMVRLGIGMYGISGYEHFQHNLQQVSELKSVISQVKVIKKGAAIGYDRKELANTETTIAIIPIGYADGLSRVLGNRKGKMIVNGHKVDIIGNVCMDMCMLDITNVTAHEGDPVTIFGTKLSIIEYASSMNTIPYEALTSVSPRVKRVYFQE